MPPQFNQPGLGCKTPDAPDPSNCPQTPSGKLKPPSEEAVAFSALASAVRDLQQTPSGEGDPVEQAGPQSIQEPKLPTKPKRPPIRVTRGDLYELDGIRDGRYYVTERMMWQGIVVAGITGTIFGGMVVNCFWGILR